MIKNNFNKFVRRALLFFKALTVVSVLPRYGSNIGSSLVQIFHAPKRFSRRYADFTANIAGSLAPRAKQVKYRLNDGPWFPLRQGEPRVPPPLFTIEFYDKELRSGVNYLTIEAN
ncbi:MAG: hypothetical protein L0Y56_02595, partial [Nitrospira sp.]|nr:hypothetical protein [Nitrospira sp.]